MQFSLLPISTLISLAAAQTITFSANPATSTTCAGQPVLDLCLASTKLIVAQCGSTDWGCLCQKWNDVLTCYTASGCSEDAGIATAQNSKDTYCAQASIYTSTTSSAISRDIPTTTTATTATGTDSSSAQTTGNNGDVRVESTSSGTATGASATQSGNAASKDLVVGAGSMMMGLAGLVGAFL
ncbi:hypothetical protein ONS95_003148 [Cadophora gregata]|uniref:uncharacterized protein n=1 Tax=Cadophora gregata TaxID=51156 RepID=UPI0026DD9EAB|nr:uncharacterized protein ONS95_003148 [Cadophora gregata]KAK0108333.1 hypothetical protein ONS95_003148 [Cadophora gregata]KAK0109076.1 hypothetical protein ONS96_002905 [Cadophora gregata f. sp. sojae]